MSHNFYASKVKFSADFTKNVLPHEDYEYYTLENDDSPLVYEFPDAIYDHIKITNEEITIYTVYLLEKDDVLSSLNELCKDFKNNNISLELEFVFDTEDEGNILFKVKDYHVTMNKI